MNDWFIVDSTAILTIIYSSQT